MHILRTIGFTLWSIITLFILLTWFTSLEFNNVGIRTLFYFIVLSGIPVILLFTTKDKVKKRKLLIWSSSFIIISTIILRIGSALTFGSGFVTQELQYINKGNPQKRVEFQMEDIGAFGYNRRTVEIETCCFLFSWIKDVHEKEFDDTDWEYVAIYKNELGLKGE